MPSLTNFPVAILTVSAPYVLQQIRPHGIVTVSSIRPVYIIIRDRACVCVRTSFMFGSGVTLVVCTVLAWSGDGFSLVNFIIEAPAISDTESEGGLNRHAMFTAGATILGLVAFGSLLNLLVTPSPKQIYSKNTVRILAFGIASGTLGSLFLMFSACCVPHVGIGLFVSMLFIAGGAITIMLWVARAFDDLIEYWKRGAPKDKEQAGDSPPS